MQDQFDAAEVARFENATWSRCAKGYMNGFGALVAEGIGPLLDQVEVTDGDRVLDLGTGPGLVAAEAAERGADPVGIDFSEAMLAEARRAELPHGPLFGVSEFNVFHDIVRQAGFRDSSVREVPIAWPMKLTGRLRRPQLMAAALVGCTLNVNRRT